MAEINLKASTGRPVGTGPSKRLRVEGKVPGIVYGLDADPVPVTVEWKPFRETLITDAGLNVLIDLDVDGEVSLCMVKELQRHPIRGDVLHVDFLRVSRDAAISVDVPIVVEGEAEKVEREGGTVDHVLFALPVNAKPANIPNEIVVDITELDMGDTIRVADLPLPSGVETDMDPEEAVVTTVYPDVVAEPTEGEEGEGEAAGEGAEGEAGGEATEGGDEG